MKADPYPRSLFAAHHPDAFDGLTDLEAMALAADPWFHLRPDQVVAGDNYRYLGAIAGRGYGKGYAIVNHFLDEVEEHGTDATYAALAQDEDRAYDLCFGPMLAMARPWFRPELFKDKLWFPNGASVGIYSPEAPDKVRGPSFSGAYCTELAFWSHHGALDCFQALATAVRAGRSRIYWDSTSKDVSPVITHLLTLNERRPDLYPIIRGTMYDNPLLGADYLREQVEMYTLGSRRYGEEILGEVFASGEGALFSQAWLNDYRVHNMPDQPDYRLVGFDPSGSNRAGSDQAGIIVAVRSRGEYYVTADRSGLHSTDSSALALLDEHEKGAALAVIERNKFSDYVVGNLRAIAQQKGIQIRPAPTDELPPYLRGTLYVRELFSRGSKTERAEPAAVLTEKGKVHLVGVFPDLERELTTYAGTGLSPNRFDAFAMAITELSGVLTTRRQPGAHTETNAATAELSRELRHRLSSRALDKGVI